MSYYFITTDNSIGKKFSEKDFRILSPAELVKSDTKQIHSEAKGLIILCEINMNEEGRELSRQSLYGIEFARKLRSDYDFTLPIILTSFISLPTLLKLSPHAGLIKAIGHDFIRLPATPEHFINRFREMEKLTNTELHDVQLFSCQPEGIVRTKTHLIPALIEKVTDKPDKNSQLVKRELEDCLEEMHFAYRVNHHESLDQFRKNFPDITTDNVREACDFVKTTGEQLIRNYSNDENSLQDVKAGKRKWKLLMLDDELGKENEIVKMLEKKGVSVVCKTNAESAMRALDREDKLRGKITLLLCDYRLLERHKEYSDITDVYQKTQGYTFLQQVGERFQSRLLSAIVYSGLPRQFLLETFKTYKIRTEIYSKIDFGPDNPKALDYLTTRIAELGDANYDALMALPLNNVGWESCLHEWYLYYRSLKDYEQREREISEYCNQWITELRLGNQPEPPLSKGAKMTPMVKEPEKCTACNSIINNQDKNYRDKEKDLERFIEILKARRIAQYLYLNFIEVLSEKEALSKIHSRVKPKNFGESEPSRKQLSFTLGLKLSEFPLGATIEELNWLHYDRGINILDKYKEFRANIYGAEKLTLKLICEMPYLQELIKDNNFIITQKIVDEESKKEDNSSLTHVLKFEKANFKPHIFDRTDLGCIIKWLSSQIQKRAEEKEMKYFMNEYCDKLNEIWTWPMTKSKRRSFYKNTKYIKSIILREYNAVKELYNKKHNVFFGWVVADLFEEDIKSFLINNYERIIKDDAPVYEGKDTANYLYITFLIDAFKKEIEDEKCIKTGKILTPGKKPEDFQHQDWMSLKARYDELLEENKELFKVPENIEINGNIDGKDSPLGEEKSKKIKNIDYLEKQKKQEEIQKRDKEYVNTTKPDYGKKKGTTSLEPFHDVAVEERPAVDRDDLFLVDFIKLLINEITGFVETNPPISRVVIDIKDQNLLLFNLRYYDMSMSGDMLKLKLKKIKKEIDGYLSAKYSLTSSEIKEVVHEEKYYYSLEADFALYGKEISEDLYFIKNDNIYLNL